MCGIFCWLSVSATQPVLDTRMYEYLRRRGPNSSQDCTVTGANSFYQCMFSAHVLHMRGSLTPQPLQDSAGNVLMWNGEIFGGLPVSPEENDTEVLFRQMSTCNSPAEVLSVLASVRGPWAFVYYQQIGDFLWFGRDFFGRRSLLWQFDVEGNALTLTSVAVQGSGSDHSQWHEVPAVGVYRIDLKAAAGTDSLGFEVYPWANVGNDRSPFCPETKWEGLPSNCTAQINQSGLVLASPVSPLNESLPEVLNNVDLYPNLHPSAEDLEHLLASIEKSGFVDCLIDVLSEAVRRRVQCLPTGMEDNSLGRSCQASVAILFSGGIDSMILAALADRHTPAHQPIDLLNVAFKLQEPKMQKESTKKHRNKHIDSGTDAAKSRSSSLFDVPDRITGRAGLVELQGLNPERIWNFVEINVTQDELQKMRQERICHLVHPLDTVLDDSIGCAVWFAARGVGFITEDNDQKPFTSSATVKYMIQTLHFPGEKVQSVGLKEAHSAMKVVLKYV